MDQALIFMLPTILKNIHEFQSGKETFQKIFEQRVFFQGTGTIGKIPGLVSG
jgi:hypothetical protein